MHSPLLVPACAQMSPLAQELGVQVVLNAPELLVPASSEEQDNAKAADITAARTPTRDERIMGQHPMGRNRNNSMLVVGPPRPGPRRGGLTCCGRPCLLWTDD